MSDVVEARQLALDEFDERYSGLRLQATAEARQAMIQSLRRYGQLSPVVHRHSLGQSVRSIARTLNLSRGANGAIIHKFQGKSYRAHRAQRSSAAKSKKRDAVG